MDAKYVIKSQNDFHAKRLIQINPSFIKRF